MKREIIVQLSLGMSAAPNTVRLSGLTVERMDFDFTDGSVLSGVLDYSGPGGATFWAHEDYEAAMTGSHDAATVSITTAPKEGAEPRKKKALPRHGSVPQARQIL